MKIAIYNNKGGVGKTTLAAHIGFRAIEKKQKLMVYDVDSRQGNTIDWLTGGNWDGNATVQLTPYVWVTTDNNDTEGHELVVIDCPPTFQVVEKFDDVDVWLVPVSGRFSVMSAMNVIEEIRQIERKPRIVLVSNMVDTRTEFGRTEINEIKKLGVELFKFHIPRHDAIRKAEMAAMPAWKVPYGTRSMATQHLMIFADWVLNGCSEKGVYSKDSNGSQQ